MTKKASIIKSLESVSILFDRISDENSFEETMQFIRFVLDGKVRRLAQTLPFSKDILELVDCAIAYSDDLAAFSYALDDLFVAIECL